MCCCVEFELVIKDFGLDHMFIAFIFLKHFHLIYRHIWWSSTKTHLWTCYFPKMQNAWSWKSKKIQRYLFFYIMIQWNYWLFDSMNPYFVNFVMFKIMFGHWNSSVCFIFVFIVFYLVNNLIALWVCICIWPSRRNKCSLEQ